MRARRGETSRSKMGSVYLKIVTRISTGKRLMGATGRVIGGSDSGFCLEIIAIMSVGAWGRTEEPTFVALTWRSKCGRDPKGRLF